MTLWVKRLEAILMIVSLALTIGGITSCSEFRAEFAPHTWRYQPYRDMPPSWANDMGRPGPEYGGEDMFGDRW